ncbi:hypothetical protein CFB84_25195 [Burkholderia aenigmatica]|uniref:Uncharacterized protein n=1 Tax=Burkholderia aenigmatica TaxID=2015348 RepID=A0A228IB46_9BURK|nr:hypothetical protein CFB84_25195 [Burkholderia aenigmatica]
MAKATTRSAIRQDAVVRVDRLAGRVDLADLDVQAQHMPHVANGVLQAIVDRARFGAPDAAAVECCGERDRSQAGDRSSQPRSVYHRTDGATRGTNRHGLVRHAARKR